MTPTPPYPTTLAQTSPGDTIAYTIPEGGWATGHAGDLDGLTPGDTPVVVLEKARAWPTEAIILIRKGRKDDAELRDVVAARDSDGDYKLVGRYGWLIADNSEYKIEEWEPLTPVHTKAIDDLIDWIESAHEDRLTPHAPELAQRARATIASAAAIKKTLA